MKMGYETLLRWTLAPTIGLFTFALIGVVLTTHYWILSDWFLARYLVYPGGLDVLIDYQPKSTDATIVSFCLGLFAGVVCFLAWYKLRRQNMDMDHNLVRGPFHLVVNTGSYMVTRSAN
jgi:hypothetical protein